MSLRSSDSANFIWFWGSEWLLTTTHRENFVWSDPAYGGNNTIRPYRGSIKDYCKELGVACGRDKGRHIIEEYCGDKVVIINESQEARARA